MEMSLFDGFDILFSNLKTGKHLFNFKVTDSFFEPLDYSEIKKGNLKVKISLNKQSTMMVLDFDIKGTVKLECDRCMEEFDFPIKTKQQLVAKFSNQDLEDANDEIVSLSPNASEINVGQYIYEYIVLAIPYRKVHPDVKGKSTCNPKMLEKLEQVKIKEGNEQAIDPRWEKLKSLKLSKN